MTEDEFWEYVGEKVRECRHAAGMTQEALASELGYERTSIVNLEAGRQRIPAYMLYCVAYELGVELGDLLPAS